MAGEPLGGVDRIDDITLLPATCTASMVVSSARTRTAAPSSWAWRCPPRADLTDRQGKV